MYRSPRRPNAKLKEKITPHTHRGRMNHVGGMNGVNGGGRGVKRPPWVILLLLLRHEEL